MRALSVPDISHKPRSFFDKLAEWATQEGLSGLGYILFEGGQPKGPLTKFFGPDQLSALQETTAVVAGGGIFFICAPQKVAEKSAGALRKKLGEDLNLIEKDVFKFCWVVDFPMYEWDEVEKKIVFSHNPFSMPQGGLEALETQDPLSIKAFQYDIVCNGIELSSGAIRNHLPEVMFKAFQIAGYGQKDVEERFGGLLKAFQYGAPPHGGSAPGVDRIVMLLADEPNIREIIAFPLNQQAQDLLMNAPASIDDKRLAELGLKLIPQGGPPQNAAKP